VTAIQDASKYSKTIDSGAILSSHLEVAASYFGLVRLLNSTQLWVCEETYAPVCAKSQASRELDLGAQKSLVT
jgi:hypothetical protein